MNFRFMPVKVYKIQLLGGNKGPRLEWAVYDPEYYFSGSTKDVVIGLCWNLQSWSHDSRHWKDRLIGVVSMFDYFYSSEEAWDHFIKTAEGRYDRLREKTDTEALWLSQANKRRGMR